MTDETHSGDEEEDLDIESLEDKDEDYETRKKKRLSEEDRAEIREKAELGLNSTRELADAYGVTRQYLSRWFKEQGIVVGSRKHELAAAKSIGIKAAAEKIAERYAEQRMTWIEETRIAGFQDLKRARLIANKTMADALKSGARIATVDDDFKAAHRYVRIISQSIESTLRILEAENVVNEDDLPDLSISDMTAEKIIEHHRMNGVEDEEELDEILKSFETDPSMIVGED